jgi:tetratricopeptide (TPR) repeat protein
MASMKAERRHELKHNELADWIGEMAAGLKPHANGVLIGLAILAAIVLGSVWYFSLETATASRAWSQYFDAFSERDPQKVLQTLATEQSGSKAAGWALLAAGDMDLGIGCERLYSDRTEARKRLESAKEVYLKAEAASDPMIKTRARLGLGKVYEALCEPDKARDYYQKVADSEKDSAIGKAAAADARRMKDSREVEFLAWFEKQTPKRPAPFPGAGGMTPGLPTNLPERPDMPLPKLGLDNIGTSADVPPPTTFPPPAPTATTPTSDTSTTDAEKSSAAKSDIQPASATAEPPKTTSPDAGEKKSPK